MAEVVVRPAASVDIAAIYVFSAEQFGIVAADDYHSGMQASIVRLADFPMSGAIYPGLRPAIRYLTFRRHHIFYEYDGQTVWIVRVLHHAMDVGRSV